MPLKDYTFFNRSAKLGRSPEATHHRVGERKGAAGPLNRRDLPHASWTTSSALSDIRAIGRAVPPHYYPSEVFSRAALLDEWRGSDHERARVERIHRAAGVRGRHLALPLEEYRALGSFAAAERGLDTGRHRPRGEALEAALRKSRPRPERRRPHLLQHRDRHRLAEHRRQADQSARHAPRRQAHADLRARLRRRRRGHGARRRLSARLSRSGRGAALGRALLAHPAAPRPLDRQRHRDRALRRRRGGGRARRAGARAAPPVRACWRRARSSSPTPRR